MVPLIVGVASSVVAPEATVPVTLPKLSVMAVIAAVVVGVISRVNFCGVDAVPRMPSASTQAVIE